MNEQTDGRMNEWTDGWTDRWMDGVTDKIKLTEIQTAMERIIYGTEYTNSTHRTIK